MDWPLLKRPPRAGDVLKFDYDEVDEDGIKQAIVVVTKQRKFSDEDCEVEVLWLAGHVNDGKITTHYGGLSSWRGWRKL